MASTVRLLDRSGESELRRVMEAALAVDRYPGFNAWELEQELTSIVGFSGGPTGAVVALEDGVICGYVSARHEDLTVHPAYRRRGHGRRLLSAGQRQAAAEGLSELILYVPEAGPGRDFAVATGMKYRSSLWRMDLPAATAVPAPAFPADFVTRAHGDWLPLPKYVALLNDAFASHPTPVSWTVDAIAHAQAQPGFDPSTSLLVCPAETPDDPVGFARAVLGPPEEGVAGPVGEVRVIGVLPAWRGRGLGRELLRWGVAHVREQGAVLVKLAVEAENELALALYERNGFERAIEWPHWVISVSARVPGVAG
jgi:mycothiol synthase